MFLSEQLWGPTSLEYVIKFALAIILFTYSTQLGMNVKHYIAVFFYIILKSCPKGPSPMGNFLDFFYYLLYNNVPRKGELI